MTTETQDEPVENMIGWRYFALCGAAGLAPYGLLMACVPLFDHFNCKLSWQAVCDGHSWVAAMANAVTGFSWLVMLTFPLSVISQADRAVTNIKAIVFTHAA